MDHFHRLFDNASPINFLWHFGVNIEQYGIPFHDQQRRSSKMPQGLT
jgi:hypothetical protein